MADIADSSYERVVSVGPSDSVPSAALNFDLLITRSGDQYRAYVIGAPGGDATVLFDLPFSQDELGWLAQTAGRRRHIRLAQTSLTTGEPQEIGSFLYDAIFRGSVRSVFAVSQREAEAAKRLLRIRLRFSDDAAALAALPWETLYDTEKQYFLALSKSSPILRYLSLPRPRPPLVVKPPLSILAVLASPEGYPHLDVEQEWQAMQTALERLIEDEKVALERLVPPTFDALQERLLDDPVHVLHFLGHGAYEPDTAEGLLLFEDSSASGHVISAKALAVVLHNHASLRLVYLNACEGATADRGNVFAGVAQTLVQQGVPAAVAMQDEITDVAAIEVARTFYGCLASGRPVDEAVTHARAGLAASGSDEWIIPVLFSRSPDNRLFAVVDVMPTPACPYPGMRTFTEEQADFFYGRDEEIEDAVHHLALNQFLTVVGPSGCGKSSLIRAGVIPALKRSHRFGDEAWDIHIMRPGDRRTSKGTAAPLQTLKEALGPLPVHLATLTFEQPTLLFIDQFEETFALTDPVTESKGVTEFLRALHDLIGRPNCYMILTVRADFYAELMAVGQLWEAIEVNRLELTPLGDDELWSAIVQPAAKQGVTVDDALAVALVDDAAGERGALPLVQETLMLLWEKVEKRRLKLNDYLKMADGDRNGLQVVIDRWADHVYQNKLSPDARFIARRVFLRLIQFGQGRDDIRRQQSVDDLSVSDDNQVLFAETLSILAENRLVTMGGHTNKSDDPVAIYRASTQVDISHEALITSWETLRRWIEDKREAENKRRRFEFRAKEWARSGRRSGLLNDYELHEAEKWLAGPDATDLGVPPALMPLIEASKVELRRQAKKRQRTLAVSISAALLIVGLIIGTLIIRNRSQKQLLMAQATSAARDAAAATRAAGDAQELAKQATAIATAVIAVEVNEQIALENESGALVHLSELQLATDPVAAIDSARRALPSAETERPYVPEAEYALIQAIQASLERDYLKVTDNQPTTAQVAVDGPRIIVGGDLLYEVERGDSLTVTRVLTPTDGDGEPNCVAWRPQSDEYVYCSGASLWLRSTESDESQQIERQDDAQDEIEGAVWSPDGRWLAVWDKTERLTLWDMAKSVPNTVLDERLTETECIFEVVWSPSSEYLAAVTDDGRLRVWRIDRQGVVLNSEVRFYDQGQEDQGQESSCAAAGVRFARSETDDEIVVTWADDGNVKFWSLEGGLLGASRPIDAKKEGRLNGIEVSPDGHSLMASANLGAFYLLSTSNYEPVKRFEGHEKSVTSALWHVEPHRYLATCSADGTARVWDTKTDRELIVLRGHRPMSGHSYTSRTDVRCLRWFDDGVLLTAGEDGTLRVWQIFDEFGQPVCIGEDNHGILQCTALSRPLTDSRVPMESVRWHDNQTLLTTDTNGRAKSLSLPPDTGQILSRTVVSSRSTAIWDPTGHYVLTYDDTSLFSFDPDSVSELDAAKIPQTLHEEFIHDDKELSPKAVVQVKQSGNRWTIFDDKTRYEVCTKGKTLNVYEPSAGQIWKIDTSSMVRELDADAIKAAWWLDAGILYTDQCGQSVLFDPMTGDAVELQEYHSPICEAQAHGTVLAAAHRDGVLRILNIRDGTLDKLVEEREPSPFITYDNCSLQWKRDGSALLSAGSDSYSGYDYVSMWDTVEYTKTWSITFEQHASYNGQALFSSDEGLVAAAIDSAVYILGSTTGRVLAQQAIHSKPVMGLEWATGPSWDGTDTRHVLLSWAKDGTARLWDWNAEQMELTEIMLVTDYAILDDPTTRALSLTSASISPDGTRLATAGSSGAVRIWPVCIGDPESALGLAEKYMTHPVSHDP